MSIVTQQFIDMSSLMNCTVHYFITESLWGNWGRCSSPSKIKNLSLIFMKMKMKHLAVHLRMEYNRPSILPCNYGDQRRSFIDSSSPDTCHNVYDESPIGEQANFSVLSKESSIRSNSCHPQGNWTMRCYSTRWCSVRRHAGMGALPHRTEWPSIWNLSWIWEYDWECVTRKVQIKSRRLVIIWGVSRKWERFTCR